MTQHKGVKNEREHFHNVQRGEIILDVRGGREGVREEAGV